MKPVQFLLLLIVIPLLSCEEDVSIIISSDDYTNADFIGNWIHVSSNHRYPEESEQTGLYTEFVDDPVFELEIFEDRTFLFNRYNEYCVEGKRYEYFKDDLGYSFIRFDFNCDFEWQGEEVNTLIAELIIYPDRKDVLILSHSLNYESCESYCSTAYLKVSE